MVTVLFTKNFELPACEKHKKRTQKGTRTEQEHELGKRGGELLRRERRQL
jgi:hypothetical protein